MKFKKYINESNLNAKSLTINEAEEFTHPDSVSYVMEADQAIYEPIRKMILAGKYDKARDRLSELEKDLDEFEKENASRRWFFRVPQFTIDSERKLINSLKAKLPVSESVEDMDKRCEKCNNFLNDGGTCPKCDDGEEDIDSDKMDDLDESQKSCVVSETLSEESNKEKLKRAFPELNFDEPLTEGSGADTKKVVMDIMGSIAKDDSQQWASTVSSVAENIPDQYLDDIFEGIKKVSSDLKLDDKTKKKIVDESEGAISEEAINNADTFGKVFDLIDMNTWANKNPKAFKAFVLTVLTVVSIIEPTPIVEIITGIIIALPENVVAKIIPILNSITNPVAGIISLINFLRKKSGDKNEELEEGVEEHLSAKEKLERAFPGVFNFDVNVNEDVQSQGETFVEGALSKTLKGSKFVYEFWNSIPEDKKGDFLKLAFEELKDKDIKDVWPAVKDFIVEGDRALTEEDKDELVRKLKIDRKILDGVDNVSNAIILIMELVPLTLGIVWDLFQLGPIDEAVAAVPVIGPILALITGFFSFLPEGVLIGIITSIGVDINNYVCRWLKDRIIHDVIPEPEDTDKLKNIMSVDKNSNTSEVDENLEEEFEYDDDYDLDDVEQDRAHAALYGGERMYCDCGKKLSMGEYGSYCPSCDRNDDLDDVYDDEI